jgi:Ribosomal RNA large subunit methyltransferase D, RlmJ
VPCARNICATYPLKTLKLRLTREPTRSLAVRLSQHQLPARFSCRQFCRVFKHIVLSCIFVAPLRETNGFPLYRHSRRKRNLAPPAEFPLQRYPGSPAIAQALLRRHDRMFLCELHPRAFSKLKAILGARMKLDAIVCRVSIPK